MRVILITPACVEYSVELANALSAQRGVDVKLLMPKDYVTTYLRHHLNKILRENIDTCLFAEKSLDIKTLPSVYRIIKYIYEVKPDIIHIQEFGNVVTWLALPFISKCPVVATIHEPEPPLHQIALSRIRRDMRVALSKIFIKYYDKLIVHGEYLKRLAMSNFKRKREDVHVIPHGELSIFQKFDSKYAEQQSNSILFFGRLTSRKGFEYLIEAQPLIRQAIPDARIIVAGQINLTEYRKLIVNEDSFEMHSRFIPYDEVGEFFQRCALVVLPYTDASQSGVIPVAYAYGKPVIATNVGSIPDVVENGVTGFLIPPRNARALAEAIIKLLKNNELRVEMGRNAYKKAKEDLSWERIAIKTIAVYQEAIEAHRDRRIFRKHT